jgi:hypothetical protein
MDYIDQWLQMITGQDVQPSYATTLTELMLGQ